MYVLKIGKKRIGKNSNENLRLRSEKNEERLFILNFISLIKVI
jgi:hypothetical protein